MAASSDAFLDTTRVSHPTVENGVAHGLPRHAYTSNDILKLEFERLFARTWTFVGFAHDIPEPGDVQPVSAAGQPILLSRNAAGEINAFHNVCRHRGHILVDQPCRGLRSLVCPYHAWTYDLDGRLKRTPHFGGYGKTVEEFALNCHGLLGVRCGVWHDWIFVDLSGEAPALEDHLAPVIEHLEGLDFGKLRVLADLDLGVVKANWKLLIENFVEPYHVPVVHSQSAGGSRFGITT